MDLIYTNSQREDIGVLSAYSLDISFGESENDFQLIVSEDLDLLEYNSVLYIEGTEYGGIIDTIETSSNGTTVTYSGRTWHGILNSKIIEPDVGEPYLIVSGEANAVLIDMVERLGLSSLFEIVDADSGISINRYQFYRYCKGYDGIKAMLSESGAKLHIEVKDGMCILSAIPVVDYTDYPEDNDTSALTVEHCANKVNHLICLGNGELTEREVIHLYADQYGNIGDTQYYTGLGEVADTYELAVSDDLENDGIKRLKELRDVDTAEIKVSESSDRVYDIGDIVGASEIRSGICVTGVISQKIITINNGAISINYKVGG